MTVRRFLPLLLAAVGACGPPAPADLEATLTLEPSPPRVGRSELVLELEDELGPLRGARLAIEANMNHAGMVPVFADGRETDAGRYASELEFTMAGDWFLLVTATTSEGEVRRAQIEVPRVEDAR